MPDVRKIVQELLAQLGSSREAQQYLKEFSETNKARFAVVKVGGGILRDLLEELLAPESIHEKPDRKACELEGLEPRSGPLRGAMPACNWARAGTCN